MGCCKTGKKIIEKLRRDFSELLSFKKPGIRKEITKLLDDA
jgi:hypothetical protein